MIFAINGCSIDTDAYEVRREGNIVPVEPQVFDLLVLLLDNSGRVVTKDEIIERVWHGRIVSEAALSSRIKAARQAIGDTGASQALIRTIRGRGFRVVGEVSQSKGAPALADGREAAADPAGPGDAASVPSRDAQDPKPATADAWRLNAPATIVLAPLLFALLLILGWRAVVPGPAAVVPITPAALGMPAGPSIAVLRFQGAPGDATSKFLSDAIGEEIATRLTRFSDLRVIARPPVREAAAGDADEAGQDAGAQFLVKGSLRQGGERLRVTAQLIRAADAKLLWAESYERQLTPSDIFDVEDDIANKIVAAVASISAGVIARETLGQVRSKAPRELSAYECIARANEIMNSGFSAATHLSTRTCLEAVVATEPDYATAWAMLSWLHTLEFSYGYNKRAGSDPRERAMAAARRSVELAPGHCMSRFAMARAAYLLGDLQQFYGEAAAALKLNPHDPFLLGNLGTWLSFTGRWDEGTAMVRKAIDLNPKVYPRWWHAALGKDHYRKGEYAAALVEFKSMSLPNWWWNQVELAYTYGQLGDRENGRAAVTRLLELYPGFDLDKAVLEHRKFSFETSYIELAVDGLRKAGVPAGAGRTVVR
jgi:TolB-like protein/DNA-binding winged helix-turn-helix (wHTH) protein/Flp pilus assembly protein TadD